MFKVLDLFAGIQSLRGALDRMGVEYEYFGIDIYGDDNLHLDLSQDNITEKIKDKLPDGWLPDFIWASPLCTTFSRATCIKNGTLSYTYIDGVLKLRDDFSYITHNNYKKYKDDPKGQKEQIKKGVLGLKLLENTKSIINHYGVNFAIENPAYALSRYLMDGYKRNVTNYCMYGFKYKKSTAIYTMVNLNLLKCNHKGQHEQSISSKGGRKGPSGNKERSRVPQQLIIEIILKLKGERNV